MKKKYCDYCGKNFSDRDEYVNASTSIEYTRYDGDDGSEHINQQNDLCEKCLGKMIKLIEKFKR